MNLKIYSEFFRDIGSNWKLIRSLTINDLRTRYASSYFGVFWAFVQPVITILVFWCVFELGFRSAGVKDVPFILWLSAGIVPWFFFLEGLTTSANTFVEYSYLVKKVAFKIEILPLVKIFSALIIHIFFVVFLIFIFALYSYKIDKYFFQLIYYSFCTLYLLVGLGYLTSSIVVMFKDFNQIVGIILQFGFWITPVLWDAEMLSDRMKIIFALNPMYYVVQGYRDSTINKIWFYEHYRQSAYFWCVSTIILLLGIWMFKKLKIHFPDVL